MSRSRAVVALLALCLALPSAAFAQGAGDEQYQDPFGDEQTQGDGNGGGANGRAAQDDGGLSDEPPVQDEPQPPPEEPAEEPAQDPGQGDEPAEEPQALPNTGSDPRLLAYVGLLFVLIGVGLRLRTIDPDAY
ncbi:MAG TPA: LPXTG cell wall anchor domain-containing protein [Solirubrobacteraceae bacterium]|nr:LPXTG cell wall anchor domain-containing protein [Solirubrobacteraceae bacterium]